ncbi:phosphoribosyltransferase family protein [Rhizobium sp. YS-1r]|uniref:phosphoribosyltransferase family protein n=1 Tax=Rhizobium sp. YS-1r TaxID=1532558 RepID=UPI00126A2E8D|nr:phosphoribosyltransferase family protein [Rhizobium sp. YS-1r]
MDGPEPIVVRNEEVIRLARVSPTEFEGVQRREIAEIECRRRRYLGGRSVQDVSGRVAIIVDDGIATGVTMLVRSGIETTQTEQDRRGGAGRTVGNGG